MTELRDAALAYAERGWAVFPCLPRDKPPLARLVPHGLKQASTSDEQVAAWWTAEPDANVAIACGQVSGGLFVLDVDARAGASSLAALEDSYHRLPDTAWVRTGAGWQAYFTVHRELRNTARRLGPGIDTRCDGGYVIAPPSIHPSGRTYRWKQQGAPVAALPSWVIALLTRPVERPKAAEPPEELTDAYVKAALERESSEVARTQEGGRNHRLNAAAWTLARFPSDILPNASIEDALMNAARAAGLSHAEAEATIRSGLSRRKGVRT